MSDEPTAENATLYALGLLDGEELRRFSEQLRGEPALRREVDSANETAALLAHLARPAPLPLHLEEQIKRQLGFGEKKITRFSAPAVWIPWAMAACLALACVLLYADRARTRTDASALHDRESFFRTQIAALETKLSELRDRDGRSRTELASLKATLSDVEARDPLSRVQVATLNSQVATAPQASAVVLWDPEKQRGVLTAIDVPGLSSDRDYQLWIVDPKYKQPVSAGTFSVRGKGVTKFAFKPDAPISNGKAFAVSLERKGGVAKAEGPMILASR